MKVKRGERHDTLYNCAGLFGSQPPLRWKCGDRSHFLESTPVLCSFEPAY